MRIALVHATLPNPARPREGGVTYTIHGLANALARHGQDVTVFSLDPRPADALYEHRFIPLPRTLAGHWLGRYQLLAWYVARLDFTGFDVLHSNGEDWLLAARKTPPRVRTYWGSAIGEAASSTRLRRTVTQALIQYPIELAAGIGARRRVGISAVTARQLPFIDTIIPPGVDLSAFHPGQKAEHPVILFVSQRLGGRKRGDALLRAFGEAVRPAMPEAELWMRCADEVPTPGVRWIGTVDEHTLAALYRQAWIACQPSSYEGFGIPYVEGLASGTAVVATPNGGAREVLAEGEYGVLTPLSKLGDALLGLLRDSERRARLERRGPERAQRYSWDAVVARYLDVYHAAIASG